MNELTWRGVALVGLVLATIAIWLDYAGNASYWDDGTQGVFLLAVAAIAALLLVGSIMQNRVQWARGGAALAAVLLGYHLFYIALFAFGNWGDLEAGAWLGIAGAAVAFLGAWLGSQSLGTEPMAASTATPQMTQIWTLAAMGGTALCIVSIWLNASDDRSYWNAGEDKMLGIVMLVVGALTALALVATWMNRSQAAALWASVFATVLLGLFAVLPVAVAFGDFGSMQVGAWLGFIGGLAAVIGAQMAHMATARTVPSTVPAPAI